MPTPPRPLASLRTHRGCSLLLLLRRYILAKVVCGGITLRFSGSIVKLVLLGFIKKLWTGMPYLCRVAARDVEPRSGPLEPRSGPPRAAIAPLCGRHPGANHMALTREAVSSCSSCALQRLRPRGVYRPRALNQRADERGRHLLLPKDAPPRPFMIARCQSARVARRPPNPPARPLRA